jgi:hypothetical protein
VKGWVKFALVALSLGVLYWPGIQYHWQASKDPYFVPYDAVQYIPAFFKYDAKDPIPTTYAKEYYLNVLSPPLYKALTRIGAQLVDVRQFQLATMYVAYAAFLLILGRLAWTLGGATLSFAVLALTITSWIFIGLGFIGGAPRMYGYPLISLILYSLMRDCPYLLAATVVLGGLLYPVVAIIGGACLFVWMFVPNISRGLVSRWGLSRRLMTVTLTGFLTLAALAPLLVGGQLYGRRVVVADIANFPEAGPEGNYRPYDQLPYKLFGIELFTYFVGPMYSHGDPLLPWLNIHKQLDDVTVLFVLAVSGFIVFLVILRGIKSALREDQENGAIRLITFFAVCGILHVIAWLAAPYVYIPTRYFMFSLPFLVTLVFPWSLYLLLKRAPSLQSSPKLRNIVFLSVIIMYLMAFGGRGNVQFSESATDKASQPLFDAIASLPPNVVIAGWPLGHLRKMEYVTRRNVFLTGDLHQVLHIDFIKTMRERMDALFEAYFSIEGAPLYRLRQQFGVTHLLVEERDFTDPEHTPEYFEPWKSRIQPRLAEIKGKEYLLNESLRRQTAVLNQNGLILLDLKRLP